MAPHALGAGGMAEAKTSNLLRPYLARGAARWQGAFEALLVDRHGFVLEGTRSNFYGIRGNAVYTAPDDKVLNGITRISVLKAASELGFRIIYEPPRFDELLSYESVFISATSMAAMPLSHIDGTPMRKERWEEVLDMMRLVRKWE